MIVEGQRISNRYEIIKLIGEGGMANVYLAYDHILDRNVAVKVLRGDLSADDTFVRRFQREALAATSLSHENIVEMYDIGEDSGIYFIVMEYIQGYTLKQLIKKRKRLSINEVLDIMLQLTDALSHAHNEYIIHRDIKPQNILILNNGLVKITDFGIATALNNSQITQTNSVMGSVHYLPPEQAGGKGSTIKSDIYSLGIMMYELLTGKLPFTGETAVEIALKHLKERIPAITNELDNIPQSIENIILKACAKNPKNRYNNAQEMNNDLKNALNLEHQNDSKLVYFHSEGEIEDIKIEEPKEVIEESNDYIENEKLEKAEKSKNKLVVILLGIIAVIMSLILVLFIILPKYLKTEDVTIPDISNLSIEEAEAMLKSLDFVIKAETQTLYSDDIKEGNVIKTSPAIGKMVKKGTEITIYISLGTKKVVIEDYTGKNIYEIKAKLELLGIIVSIESKDVENVKDYLNKGNEIIDQDIKSGTLIEGSQIILYYPNINVYPNMIGWYEDDVKLFAETHNLNLTIRYEESEEEIVGIVILQNRTEGTPIITNSSLIVTISIEKEIIIEEPVIEPEVEEQEE